ncbi:MAG: RDD family protein [Vicinamibacterales bacterium]
MQSADSRLEGSANFELPAIKRQTDSVGANALDLDRLFGQEEAGNDDGVEAVLPVETVQPAEPFDSLPFDDAPIVFPPAARPPLAVRRATAEPPRHRPRTTRPIKPQPLQLEPEPAPRISPAETVAQLMETPPLGARLGAGAIDALLLIGLDAAIVYLTLRVAGLTNTIDDVRVLSPIPFVGFLILLAFGYLATFNVAGGQTIGKMLMHLRVIGDDGRPIDAASGMLRAAGCMLVPVSLGLSYVPALVTSDHRALHDRLAGTRVVRD